MAKKVTSRRPPVVPLSEAKSKNLVEAKHQDYMIKKGSKRSHATDGKKVAAHVAECLRGSFSALSEEEQMALKIDGHTLADRIEVDIRVCMADRAHSPALSTTTRA